MFANTDMENSYTSFGCNFNILQSMLLELVKEGVMIISENLQPIYLNKKAQEICQRLWNSNSHYDSLNPVIYDIYHQIRKNLINLDSVFIMDYDISEEETIRIRACHISPEVEEKVNIPCENHPWLIFFLEDRNAILQEELRIEQNKYNLTERELEVLTLLSQSYSYKQIATALGVSLNTVKFHIKNINLKKHGYLHQEIFLQI
ncbi:LuxR family transcriptional regulator [Tolypothrix sp. PCC 7910]|uniref:LuxR C-terminal-related transcriptional regulator n=1 Tax=Tolypothrix sp. PCC 7910 TaxID=2099387 RepID=UPI0014279107|nr:LuxR C-terminal-related transcriptional regulator [Tolypothrix sp. PCC 7910]QIR40524.1 LuxR family transcriptional regulator [Tolypothrix sp. PCC 7910]